MVALIGWAREVDLAEPDVRVPVDGGAAGLGCAIGLRSVAVTGDRFGKEWVQAAWRKTGIAYVQSDLTRSDIYLECIPLFSRGLVRLPDHQKLLRELRLLHLQRHSGGRQSVDHPRGEHDDHSNAVCGVLHGLSARFGYSLAPFDPSYRDSHLPPLPSAPDLGPPRSLSEWWKVQNRSPQSVIQSADENLAQGMRALAVALKNTFFRGF